MTKIFVDNREKPETITEGRKLFPDLTVTTLPVGDVIAGNILIERKQIKDFEGSIKDSRYINQAINMITAIDQGAHPYILIEGHFDQLEQDGYSTITRKAYRGAIASLTERYGLNVIEVDDLEDFWIQVDRLIVKYNDKREIKRVYVAPSGETVTHQMLMGINGLGPARAKAIGDIFTISDLALLTPEDLQKIEGIGPKYAESVIRAVKEGIG